MTRVWSLLVPRRALQWGRLTKPSEWVFADCPFCGPLTLLITSSFVPAAASLFESHLMFCGVGPTEGQQ